MGYKEVKIEGYFAKFSETLLQGLFLSWSYSWVLFLEHQLKFLLTSPKQSWENKMQPGESEYSISKLNIYLTLYKPTPAWPLSSRANKFNE